ncbi:Hypothetical_protein [Hexamita inflata]|uniref:Hypothetical_protein n=1 Tax=Hexamita inflata TaxID=28002 RepID=A0ABP1HG34_9EUKA
MQCYVLQSPYQPVLESVINISVSEDQQVQPIQEGQILIDLKEFPDDTAPKLIKTLNKQFPDMISADVTEDLNVLVTVKQEDVEETARSIRRLKIHEIKLTCTIVNKDGKKKFEDRQIKTHQEKQIIIDQKLPKDTAPKLQNTFNIQFHDIQFDEYVLGIQNQIEEHGRNISHIIERDGIIQNSQRDSTKISISTTQILIDLKEFPENTSYNLLETLKYQK